MLISRLSGSLAKKSTKDVSKKGGAKNEDSASELDVLEVSGEAVFGSKLKEAKQLRTTKSDKKNTASDMEKRKLAKWIGELDRAGEALENAASLKNFFKYKMVLQNIMNYIAGTYELEFDQYMEEGGRGKEYVHVKKISDEMDSLFQLIKDRSKEPLKIVEKVISIKGLVIDLFS